MFTGIILESALITEFSASPKGGAFLKVVYTHPRFRQCELGDSISHNGVCLTVIEKKELSEGKLEMSFDLSDETLNCTRWLERLKKGDFLHVEPALRAGDALGGHFVSGHVDGVVKVHNVEKSKEYQKVMFSIQGAELDSVAPFLVPKGSICLDGVSLTVNAVQDEKDRSLFELMLVPHTLVVTQFAKLKAGDWVNVEADMMAKYFKRFKEFEEKRFLK